MEAANVNALRKLDEEEGHYAVVWVPWLGSELLNAARDRDWKVVAISETAGCEVVFERRFAVARHQLPPL